MAFKTTKGARRKYGKLDVSGNRRMRALGRTKVQSTMKNNTELAYAENLNLRIAAGEVHAWKYEGMKLRLATGAWYTPDFLVILADGAIEFHEVKGMWREAAKVRIKVAADNFPEFRFIAIQHIKGQWIRETFGPDDCTGGDSEDTQ